MSSIDEYQKHVTRRHFFGRAGVGLAALSSLINAEQTGKAQAQEQLAQEQLAQEQSGQEQPGGNSIGGLADLPHFAPKARRVIYLFQSGGPSQLDLLDHKPQLNERFGEEVPKSVYPDERKTTMSNAQASFATAPSLFKFPRFGNSVFA